MTFKALSTYYKFVMIKINFRRICCFVLLLNLFAIDQVFGQHIIPGDSVKIVIPDSILWAPYRIMLGHRVAHSKWGEINIRPYTYFRYLNQTAIDKTYTDGFGKP